jgi:hypothetical protein
MGKSPPRIKKIKKDNIFFSVYKIITTFAMVYEYSAK